MSVERNAPCPCGSGKKYKKCCLSKDSGMSSRTAMVLFALLMIGGAIGIVVAVTGDAGPPTNRVWSPEHGHWHDVR
ncbi:MAG: SEC-C metal-binding domain-containing protein, partial [Vicinamibacterales bacterium]|jgi:hypothetical protein|nr:SEC-C metal-binding domain-containing protein [Vicinamibacterales bacterium]MDP6609596.1 SEC-C metal-binding domain-containing protein [Vicinamibacterales bacterium]|tara:strand:- start:13200 stop:13427 length:228 start_codon:yes stop_codon:yes gene_type:complete